MSLASSLATNCFRRNFRLDGTIGSMATANASERDQDLNLAYGYLTIYYVSYCMINYFLLVKIVNSKT